MKRIGIYWSAALMLALSLCLCSAPGKARAQAAEALPELQRDWTIRVGLFVFQSETARGQNGDVGISGELERTVYYGTGYDVNIGIGYNGFDRVYNIPLTANIIAHRNNLRYGLGGGYAFGKRLDGRGMQGAVINLILGYELTHGKYPLSADLRYYFVSGADNELDGYSFTLGFKF